MNYGTVMGWIIKALLQMMFLKMFKTGRKSHDFTPWTKEGTWQISGDESMKLKIPATPPTSIWGNYPEQLLVPNVALACGKTGSTAFSLCKFNSMTPAKNKMRNITSEMVLAISTRLVRVPKWAWHGIRNLLFPQKCQSLRSCHSGGILPKCM